LAPERHENAFRDGRRSWVVNDDDRILEAIAEELESLRRQADALMQAALATEDLAERERLLRVHRAVGAEAKRLMASAALAEARVAARGDPS
jgi:hypothetical protein